MKLLISISAAPVTYKKGDRVIVKVDRGQYVLATITAVRAGKWHLLFDDGDTGAADDIEDLYGLAGPARHTGVLKRGDLPTYRLQPTKVALPSKHDMPPPKVRKHDPDEYIKLAEGIMNPKKTPAVAQPVATQDSPKPPKSKGPVWQEGWDAAFGKPSTQDYASKTNKNARTKQQWLSGYEAGSLARDNMKPPAPSSATVIEKPQEKPSPVARKATTRETPAAKPARESVKRGGRQRQAIFKILPKG